MSKVKLAGVLMVALSLLVTGCAVKDKIAVTGIGGKYVERTGILRISEGHSCLNPQGCGPAYVLLDEKFDNPVALIGEFDNAHNELLIAIEGKQKSPSEKQRNEMNLQNDETVIKIKRYRLLSTVPYRDLLLERSTVDSEKQFGCSVLWDKKLLWRQKGEQVTLIVRMLDSSSQRSVKPYIEIRYDGNTGKILATDTSPADLNPC